MKLPVILTIVCALGLGFLLGASFAPTAKRTGIGLDPSSTQNSDSSGVDGQPARELVTAKPAAPAFDDATLSSIFRELNSFQREKGLVAYVQTISPAGMPAAMARIHQSLGPDKREALSMLIDRWVEIDPAGAQGAIATTADSLTRYLLIEGVFHGLAARTRRVP